jgi:hypothetical protein
MFSKIQISLNRKWEKINFAQINIWSNFPEVSGIFYLSYTIQVVMIPFKIVQ